MGQWSTFLVLGVAVLVVNAEDCILNGREEHAWLIRITPMLKAEAMEAQGGAKPNEAKPGGAQTPGGDGPPGGDKTPGGDKLPGGDRPPGGDKPPGGHKSPGGDEPLGGDKPPGGDKPAGGDEPVGGDQAKDGEQPDDRSPVGGTSAGPAGGDEKPAGVFKFHAGYDGNLYANWNPHARPKRDDATTPTGSSASASNAGAQGGSQPGELPGAPAEKPGAPAGKPGKPAQEPGGSTLPLAGSVDPLEVPGRQPGEPGGEGTGTKDDEPGVTIMHGALIAPTKVLTTTYNEDRWMFVEMQVGYLSLAGYNKAKACMQEQWGKEFKTHPHAAEFALNAGKFGLITTHQPFKVDGEPFLFGAIGYPDVADIIKTYNNIGEGPGKLVQMYLFKDKRNKKDGSTLDVSATEFKFIPWKTCQTLDSFVKAMAATAKGTSPRVTINTYFCSDGLQGIMNETIGGITEGFDSDWYQGAPVIETQTKLPIGQYIYRTGRSGNPRIYATYSSRLAQWLGGPAVMGSLTLPPVDDGGASPPFPDDYEPLEPGESHATEGRAVRGQTVKISPGGASGGRRSSQCTTIVAFTPFMRLFWMS